jgi:hypothetical protein
MCSVRGRDAAITIEHEQRVGRRTVRYRICVPCELAERKSTNDGDLSHAHPVARQAQHFPSLSRLPASWRVRADERRGSSISGGVA